MSRINWLLVSGSATIDTKVAQKKAECNEYGSKQKELFDFRLGFNKLLYKCFHSAERIRHTTATTASAVSTGNFLTACRCRQEVKMCWD